MGVQERRKREKEGLRQEILDAARELFAREGYESVSIRKIAEKVEYAPGTIYLYFRDKAEILECLCEETFAKLSQRLGAIAIDQGDPLEALRRGLRLYIEFGLQYPHHYYVTFVMAGRLLYDAGKTERISKAGDACFSNLVRCVAKCGEAGQLRLTDIHEASQTIWAGIHGLTTLFITKPGFPFVEQTRLIDRLVDVLIEGVRSR